MEVTREQIENPYYSIFIVGPAKTGKTQSLATLYTWACKKYRKKLPFYHYDLDGEGSITLERIARAQGWLDQLHVFRYMRPGGTRISTSASPQRTTNEAVNFINEFNSLYDRVDFKTGLWKDPDNSPVIIAVDSLTALEDMMQDFLLTTRGKEIGGTGNAAVSYNDWTLLGEKDLEVIKAGKGLPAHFVLTAHEDLRQQIIGGIPGQPETNVADGQILAVPMVAGKMRFVIAKEFTVVLHSIDGYKWQTRPTARIKSAGTRLREGLPATIDQDFEKVLS